MNTRSLTWAARLWVVALMACPGTPQKVEKDEVGDVTLVVHQVRQRRVQGVAATPLLISFSVTNGTDEPISLNPVLIDIEFQSGILRKALALTERSPLVEGELPRVGDALAAQATFSRWAVGVDADAVADAPVQLIFTVLPSVTTKEEAVSSPSRQVKVPLTLEACTDCKDVCTYLDRDEAHCGACNVSVSSCVDGKSEKLRPRVMWVVDRSGSMLLPSSYNDGRCPWGCGSSSSNLCPESCPTRWKALQQGLFSFLDEQGSKAVFGLTTFPKDASCGAPSGVDLDFATSPAEEAVKTQQLRNLLLDISQNAGALAGGTPTGPTLTVLQSQASVVDAQNPAVLFLLTDGLPNCNAANANTCLNPTACQCTLSSCGTSSGGACTIGCLDDDGTLAALAGLRQKNVRTVVVALGDGLWAGAAPTLNAMAEAGGMPRPCTSGLDSECGNGDRCDVSSRTCQRRFYHASDAASLKEALTSAFQRL